MVKQLVIDLANPVDLPPDVEGDSRTFRDAIAAVLYRQGRIGPAMACRMMGLSRRAFEDRLAEFGYTAMDDADIDEELAAANRVANSQRG